MATPYHQQFIQSYFRKKNEISKIEGCIGFAGWERVRTSTVAGVLSKAGMVKDSPNFVFQDSELLKYPEEAPGFSASPRKELVVRAVRSDIQYAS